MTRPPSFFPDTTPTQVRQQIQPTLDAKFSRNSDTELAGQAALAFVVTSTKPLSAPSSRMEQRYRVARRICPQRCSKDCPLSAKLSPSSDTELIDARSHLHNRIWGSLSATSSNKTTSCMVLRHASSDIAHETAQLQNNKKLVELTAKLASLEVSTGTCHKQGNL